MDLSGVQEGVLAGALPSWAWEDANLPAAQGGVPAAVWRIGGTVAGPVGFGCRQCTARRMRTDVRGMRYAPRWDRVCVRDGRWLLDSDADQPREYLDVRGLPEVVAGRRRWAGVARRVVRAGTEAERVFALAHAVVARSWDQALQWEREALWPRRPHQVAGGDAGPAFEWWRVVGRDAVVFPEVMPVAEALLDPGMAEQVWVDRSLPRPQCRISHSTQRWPDSCSYVVGT
ncbi:hypothetical protein AB0M64_21335 [Streptomyces sp. NPDC051771]|uniref:hypothetical protein n=1 Tax=Streptomyces sp. NPDC051771 TaxID=3154847 RepID=UPI0034326B10